MKKMILPAFLLLCCLICNARVETPVKTDTLVVVTARYNKEAIFEEDFPFRVIYQSPAAFVFGDESYDVLVAEEDEQQGSVLYILQDKSGMQYKMDYDKSMEHVILGISGYEFECLKNPGPDKFRALSKEYDESPLFRGGDPSTFHEWVNTQLRYPAVSKQEGVQGTVRLSFTVNEDGSVSDVKVLDSVDRLLDKEAVRVVSSSPAWTPGKLNGEPVKVTFIFPVIFILRSLR